MRKKRKSMMMLPMWSQLALGGLKRQHIPTKRWPSFVFVLASSEECFCYENASYASYIHFLFCTDCSSHLISRFKSGSVQFLGHLGHKCHLYSLKQDLEFDSVLKFFPCLDIAYILNSKFLKQLIDVLIVIVWRVWIFSEQSRYFSLHISI